MSRFATTNAVDLVNEMIEDVNRHLDKPPQHGTSFSVFSQWLVTIFTILTGSLLSLVNIIDTKLATTRIDIQRSTTTTAASASQQHRSKAQGRRPRCKLCHARGHSDSECRTANPSAMRKRVAANSNLARRARTL